MRQEKEVLTYLFLHFDEAKRTQLFLSESVCEEQKKTCKLQPNEQVACVGGKALRHERNEAGKRTRLDSVSREM